MRTSIGVLVLAAASLTAATLVGAQSSSPAWAYGFPPLAPGEVATAPVRGGGRGGAGGPASPAGAPAAAGGATPGAARAGGQGRAPDPTPRQAKGSTLQFTTTQINDGFGPADWFPGDHPVMPDIVAHGHQAQNTRACALCHMPNGKGRPENAPVAGQTVEYIIQQLTDFRADLRHTSDPRKTNTNDMAVIAKALTEEEMKAAASYFAAMKWTPWIRVVEADVVPKTRIQGNIFYSLGDGTTEPIGNRIIEMPEDTTEAQLRNPRVGWIAYVPTGSIKKGEALATTGNGGKTLPCGVCHGPDLKGVGSIPGIAGRSPSYLARQLYDFQTGARKGTMSPLMKPVVEKLAEEDLLNLVAYASSRPVN